MTERTIGVLLVGFLLLGANACTAEERVATACSDWLSKTLAAATKVEAPELRFQLLLTQLGHACSAVPQSLQQAALTAATAEPGDFIAQLMPLMDAAKLYTPEECWPDSPNQHPTTLKVSCMEDDYVNGDYSSRIFYDMDVATYFYAKALKQALVQASVYEPMGRQLVVLLQHSAAKQQNKFGQQ